MSSSGSPPPTWDDFRERPGVDVAIQSPAAELAAVLQRYRADLDAAGAARAEARRAGMVALAGVAVLAAELDRAVQRYEEQLRGASLGRIHLHLRTLKDRLLDALGATGLEIVRLDGMPEADALDIADVEGWRHGEQFTERVVAEELDPAIRFEGELLACGRVVMGAPPEPSAGEPDEPEQEHEQVDEQPPTQESDQ